MDMTEWDAGPYDTALVRKGQGWEMESHFGLQASQTGSPGEARGRGGGDAGGALSRGKWGAGVGRHSFNVMARQAEGALPNRNKNGGPGTQSQICGLTCFNPASETRI